MDKQPEESCVVLRGCGTAFILGIMCELSVSIVGCCCCLQLWKRDHRVSIRSSRRQSRPEQSGVTKYSDFGHLCFYFLLCKLVFLIRATMWRSSLALLSHSEEVCKIATLDPCVQSLHVLPEWEECVWRLGAWCECWLMTSLGCIHHWESLYHWVQSRVNISDHSSTTRFKIVLSRTGIQLSSTCTKKTSRSLTPCMGKLVETASATFR